MSAPDGRRYHPEQFWSKRLEKDFDLRGVGHRGYSAAYNRWVYRQKGRVLDAAVGSSAGGLSALDVGSGVGWVVERLLGYGARVEGCDIAPVAVEELSRRFPGVSFFRAEIGVTPVPRPDASYELITALDVMYHVTDDAIWHAALVELARVLGPGGRLVVTDRLAGDTTAPARHVRFRSMAEWSEAAASVGLELRDVRGVFRWLSRSRGESRLDRLPDGARAPLEYALDRALPGEPHTRCAVFVKR